MDLLIDLDDTLLNFKESEKHALEKVLEKYNIPNTKDNIELYSNINKSYWEKFERKEISREKLMVERYKDFFNLLKVEADSFEEVNNLYFSWLKEFAFPYEETYDFLSECLRRNINLYLCSNGENIVQERRIELSSLNKYFKKIYISQEIGYFKPDKKFFDFVLKDAKLSNDQVFMLGDSLTSDIQGAFNASIKSIWLNRNGKRGNEKVNYEIHSLMEFFTLDIF